MQIILTVTDGPHTGKTFAFERHDHFFVGRAKFAHFRLPEKDPYFSRMHFMIEANPPVCRLLDLGSTNGTRVNGQLVQTVDLKHGDRIEAGDTVLQVTICNEEGDDQPATLLKLSPEPSALITQSTHLQGPTDGKIMAGDDPLMIEGSVIPGYILEKKLGTGGMGIVYQAKPLADGPAVAIKLLKPAVLGSSTEYQRFVREISILQKLSHRSIVRLLDVGEVNELIYFVMELVDGEDLRSWTDQHAEHLPLPIAVGIICRVLDALDYAHGCGFVHRDVKPSNILIQQMGQKIRVKLADFGLARAYQESKLSGLTLTGDICGTPKFMPPEQITDSRNVQPAADQYSSAVTLYWLLTKQYPHNFGSNIQQALQQILLSDPVPIRQRRADITEPLAEVVHKALNREPASRYPSAKHFREALQESLKPAK